MSSPSPLLTPAGYVFGSDRAHEQSRLARQALLIDPVTEDLLREAGVHRGMHVIDLGSGAGDSAFVVAKLVSPTGSVLGIESSAEAVDVARARTEAAGLSNVTFLQADISDLDSIVAERRLPTDAVTGRIILAHLPDRAAALRTCGRRLRPGALVWFLEADAHHEPAFPCPELWQRAADWWRAGMRAAGAEMRMGPELHASFRRAGLPAPALRCRTLLAGAQDAPVWWLVDLVRAVLPVLQEAGLATAEQIDIDTLEARLRAELIATGGVMVLPPVTAAWTRLSA